MRELVTVVPVLPGEDSSYVNLAFCDRTARLHSKRLSLGVWK
jgi:hypothetical protein